MISAPRAQKERDGMRWRHVGDGLIVGGLALAFAVVALNLLFSVLPPELGGWQPAVPAAEADTGVEFEWRITLVDGSVRRLASRAGQYDPGGGWWCQAQSSGGYVLVSCDDNRDGVMHLIAWGAERGEVPR